MKYKPFSGKIIMVTGAASGIGKAICQKFGSRGARVALLDFDRKTLLDAEKELQGMGIETLALVCDVTDERECKKSVDIILNRWGGIDILVNNAGITQRSPFLETDISVYRRVMDVNFFGSLHCARAAAVSLVERRGIIIITSSIAGLVPLLGRSGYCASKHALHGLFGTLRSELAPYGVRVLMVCPGFTSTNLQKRALGGNGEVTARPQTRVGRQSTPDDVAEKVYRGAIKGKDLLILSGVGRFSYALHRFLPGLYDWLMKRSMKAEIQ